MNQIETTLKKGSSLLHPLIKVYEVAGPVIRTMINNMAERMKDYNYNSIDYGLAIIDMIEHYVHLYEKNLSTTYASEIQKDFRDQLGYQSDDDNVTHYLEFVDKRFDTLIYLGDNSILGKYVKLREFLIANEKDLSSLKIDKYGIDEGQ